MNDVWRGHALARALMGLLCAAQCMQAQAQTHTRVLSFSRSAQAVVIEHDGQLLLLKAQERKPQLGLIVERVDDTGVELRFTALPVADVIARVGRGADLVALRERFSTPRNTPDPRLQPSATQSDQALAIAKTQEQLPAASTEKAASVRPPQ